jgi:hypothetical protein
LRPRVHSGDRWEDQQARIRLREGGGTTEAARAIAEAYISRVVAQVPEGHRVAKVAPRAHSASFAWVSLAAKASASKAVPRALRCSPYTCDRLIACSVPCRAI